MSDVYAKFNVLCYTIFIFCIFSKKISFVLQRPPFLSVSHVTKTFDHVTKRLDLLHFMADPCLISFYQHFLLYFTDSFSLFSSGTSS